MMINKIHLPLISLTFLVFALLPVLNAQAVDFNLELTTSGQSDNVRGVSTGISVTENTAVQGYETLVLDKPETYNYDTSCLSASGSMKLVMYAKYAGAVIEEMGTATQTVPAATLFNNSQTDNGASSFSWSSSSVPASTWLETNNLTITNSCTTSQDVSIRRKMQQTASYHYFVLSGTIPGKASCSISVSPTTLDLGSISASELRGLSTGASLSDHAGTAIVNTKCSTQGYSLTFAPSVADGTECIGSDNSVLRFCLKVDGSTLDMTTGSATYEGTNGTQDGGVDTTITVTPAKGAGTPVAGVSSGRITITAAPE